MNYKLIDAASDMWSRVYFKCIETGTKIFFECDNNVASELIKLAVANDKTITNFNSFFVSKGEKVPGLNIDGSEQYANEIEDEWGTYEKYIEARTKYIKEKVKEYPNYLFLSEFGTPVWSNINEECEGIEYEFETTFSSEYMKALHDEKMYFKYFTNEITTAKKVTFNWGLVDINETHINEEELTKKQKKEYKYEF